MTATISSKFIQADGHPSGFDYLRIGLALCVTTYHTILVCHGGISDTSIWNGGSLLRPLACFMIPSFFALSGFLVAGSLFRNTIPGFLTHRAARIFPALFCEVWISALIVGPLLTSYTLGHYFADPQFRGYLLNSIGDIHYTLPGLFHDNAFSDIVNVQLWTIPYELQCYIILTILALFRIAQKPRVFILALVVITLAAYGYSAWWAGFDYSRAAPSGRYCILSFLAGALIYGERDKIPCNLKFLLIAIAATYLLTLRMETEYFAALPVAYITVWLGLRNPRKRFIVAGADYSYGLYVYAFVIHQTVYQALPFGHIWYANLAWTLVIGGTAAFLSWTFVESKVLHKKEKAVAYINGFFDHVCAFLKTILPQPVFDLTGKLLSAGDVADHYLMAAVKVIRKLGART